MASNLIFEEKLDWCRAQNGDSNLLTAFVNLFIERTACLSTKIPIYRYVYKMQRNWDNYKMNPAFVAANNETDNNDANNNDLKRLPDDNPKRLYGIYD